ncbi:MAG: hypothetical protein FJ010_05060 [Chloroflexi bacterium]|nr:hypothetical protein [Chloroflexota bacterium]
MLKTRITGEIEAIALQILRENPGAVVRHRLLRDVLRLDSTDSELQKAREDLDNSRQVQLLAREQRQDGSWGPFHSRDSRSKQKTITTEIGVERALALGLDAFHPILVRAADYILAVMSGRLEYPDRHEKNDRWPTGMRLFLAATLSLSHPDRPVLEKDRSLWLEIAGRAFRSGKYDPEDEIEAHAELTGATVKESYLVLGNRYALTILGSEEGLLSVDLERALLSWLWERPEGILYLNACLGAVPPPRSASHLDRWLASHELLAQRFPHWVEYAQDALSWLWNRRNEDGLWDFGPRPPTLRYFPFSDDWRTPQNRIFDWTTRILVLFTKTAQSNES